MSSVEMDVEVPYEVPEQQENRNADIAKTKLNEILSKLETDKTDYDSYKEAIHLLKTMGKVEELKDIRETFSQMYPLTPEMWLDWISDEKASSAGYERITQLFERAIVDYPSVNLWLEYVQYTMNLMLVGHDANSVRRIFERAIISCGLHASQGFVIWELYRNFETAILENLSASSDKVQEEVNLQTRRIADLYRRQLSTPLLNSEATFKEFQLWLVEMGVTGQDTQIVDLNLTQSLYEKAASHVKDITPFEQNIDISEGDGKLYAYRLYIEHEIKYGGNDAHRVKCLYERCLLEFPLDGELWRDFLLYVTEFVKIPEDVLAAHHRAIRNCNWDGNLWCRYLLQLERYDKPKYVVLETFSKALEWALCFSKEGLKDLWLTYLQYLLRQLIKIPTEEKKSAWQVGVQELRTLTEKAWIDIGTSFDPKCELLVWWSRFEAEHTKDMEMVRKLWTDILSMQGKFAEYWLKYLHMEWHYGDAKHMRKLCARALSADTDRPDRIGKMWVEFESVRGSVDSFLRCKNEVEKRVKEMEGNQRMMKKTRPKFEQKQKV